jgi:UDP-2,3-diacylglucosamine pyrophosphatase LpxH
MLVIISDLHLTDGTTGMRVPAGAFELFRQRLEDMAFSASQRADGTYRPIDSFDLLLLGDILDPLRSTQWTNEQPGQPGFARPWSKPEDPAFADKLDRITDRILQENAEGLENLCSVARGEGIFLPPATNDHRADLASGQRLPVRVRMHYMIGNHDWFYHLPSAGLDRVRARVVQSLGLANPPSLFPYVPSESEVVSEVIARHSVLARHGDCYDPYNIYKQDRDHASISDATCVELLNRVNQQIRIELQGELPDGFLRGLDEMGSIRPELMTPVWIASLLDRFHATPAQRERIDGIWHALVEQFLKLDFLDELDQPFQLDQIDALKVALRFARLASIENLNDWVLAIRKLEKLLGRGGNSSSSYEKFAVQEEQYLSRQARFIIYGHTHQFAATTLRTTTRDGNPFDQMYLNAGTWIPVHEVCESDSHQTGFVIHKTLGYLGIYQGDERRGKSYETWNGTLDI